MAHTIVWVPVPAYVYRRSIMMKINTEHSFLFYTGAFVYLPIQFSKPNKTLFSGIIMLTFLSQYMHQDL